MKLFRLIIIFSTFLLGGESYKLILTTQNSHQDITPYLEACKYEMHNPLLQEHKLSCKVEYLAEDNMIVIEPIGSELIKRQLILRLYPHYPNMFFVPIEQTDVLSEIEALIETVGLEWVALLLLSVIGLVSSLYRRYQMASMQKQQEILVEKQKELEYDMKSLGVSDV